MMTKVFLAFFSSLLAMGSCRLPPVASSPPPLPPGPEVTLPCDEAPQVVYLSNPAECTSPDFDGQPLFAGATEPELQRYCIIDTNRIDEPLEQDGLTTPWAKSADCRVVAAMGEPEPWTASHEALRQYFHEQTERPTDPVPSTTAVHLALVDSAVSNASQVIDRSGHGSTLGRILEELVCLDQPNCPIHLDYVLALPRIRDDTGQVIANRDEGGYFGSFSDVASGIYTAVSRWRARTQKRSNERLVINLSLGWMERPDLAQARPEEWTSNPRIGWRPSNNAPQDLAHAPAIRAVTAALAYATCHGALVFSSAGNQTGGSAYDNGLMFPAVWQQADMPVARDCEDFFDVEGATTGHPLVYAVSAVDARGQPVTNARPGSRTTLEAPGQWAVAQKPDGTATRTLTGSSVSSALMAGAAAMYWSIKPNEDPKDLVENLVESFDLAAGHPTADFPVVENVVRRFSLCIAAKAALPFSEHKDIACLSRPDHPPGLTVPGPSRVFTAPLLKDIGALSECPARGRTYWRGNGGASFPCPELQMYTADAKPWSGPQPGEDPCPHCFYNASMHSFTMKVAPEYDNLQNPVLYLRSGLVEHAIELSAFEGWSPPAPGEVLIVEDLPDIGPVESAWIVFGSEDPVTSAPMSHLSPVWPTP